MSKPQIFLDQDEVLYNLSEYVVSIYNKECNDNFKWQDNTEYWWGSCKKAAQPYFEQLLQRKGIFIDGNPVNGAIEMINKLYEEGYDIHIITMPQLNEYCVCEKIEFLNKYFPYIDHKHIHFTADKGLMARHNRILLDDNLEHLRSWKNSGGISVAFGDFGWNKSFKGCHVNNFQEFYDWIKRIE